MYDTPEVYDLNMIEYNMLCYRYVISRCIESHT